MSRHVGDGNWLGPLIEQPVLLNAKPCFQPLVSFSSHHTIESVHHYSIEGGNTGIETNSP